MKIYSGMRSLTRGSKVTVTVLGGPMYTLPSRNDVRNHSPSGFAWGYGGSGPAQLALAILIDHLDGDTERALALYQAFKWKVIACLDIFHDWQLTSESVESAIALIDVQQMQDYSR